MHTHTPALRITNLLIIANNSEVRPGADQQWLYYRGWPANTGPNTCYGALGPINLAVL